MSQGKPSIPNPFTATDHALLRWVFTPAAQWADRRLGVNHFRIARAQLMAGSALLVLDNATRLLGMRGTTRDALWMQGLMLALTGLILWMHGQERKALAKASAQHERDRLSPGSAIRQHPYASTAGMRIFNLVLAIVLFMPSDLMGALLTTTKHGWVWGALDFLGRSWFLVATSARYWAAVWVPPGQRRTYAAIVRESAQALVAAIGPTPAGVAHGRVMPRY